MEISKKPVKRKQFMYIFTLLFLVLFYQIVGMSISAHFLNKTIQTDFRFINPNDSMNLEKEGEINLESLQDSSALKSLTPFFQAYGDSQLYFKATVQVTCPVGYEMLGNTPIILKLQQLANELPGTVDPFGLNTPSDPSDDIKWSATHVFQNNIQIPSQIDDMDDQIGMSAGDELVFQVPEAETIPGGASLLFEIYFSTNEVNLLDPFFPITCKIYDYPKLADVNDMHGWDMLGEAYYIENELIQACTLVDAAWSSGGLYELSLLDDMGQSRLDTIKQNFPFETQQWKWSRFALVEQFIERNWAAGINPCYVLRINEGPVRANIQMQSTHHYGDPTSWWGELPGVFAQFSYELYSSLPYLDYKMHIVGPDAGNHETLFISYMNREWGSYPFSLYNYLCFPGTGWLDRNPQSQQYVFPSDFTAPWFVETESNIMIGQPGYGMIFDDQGLDYLTYWPGSEFLWMDYSEANFPFHTRYLPFDAELTTNGVQYLEGHYLEEWSRPDPSIIISISSTSDRPVLRCAPLLIQSNAELLNFGVGSGTVEDPILIEKYKIIQSPATAIEIHNTDLYFKIQGCVIQDSGGQGISFYNVQNSIVTNTIIEGCTNTGFRLNDSPNNIIFSNEIHDNGGSGILLLWSPSNTITGNTVYLNTWGIVLHYSGTSLITQNQMFSNVYTGLYLSYSNMNTILENSFQNDGMFLYGDPVEQCIQEEVNQNTINGQPLLFWQNEHDKIIPAGMGQILLVNCNGIIIENQDLSYTMTGLQVAFCTNIQVKSTIISHNNDEGCWFWKSNDSIIKNSDINHNGYRGLGLYSSMNITMSNSEIHDNLVDGIYIDSYSENNSLFYNDIMDNVGWGLFVAENGNNTRVSWNNFVGNNGGGIQAYDDGLNNHFIANHWDDHTSPDDDGDNIVDKPYTIDGLANNEDPSPYVLANGWKIIPTSSGSNVEVTEPGSGATLTFSEVTTTGTTSITILQEPPVSPVGFEVTGINYDISSTASFTGVISIAIPYDENLIDGDEADLRLLHWDEGSLLWEDVTSGIDTEQNIIYGEVDSFSIFALMEIIDFEPPSIYAEFVPVDVEEDEGVFEILFFATDNLDPQPTVYAVLLLPQLNNPRIVFIVAAEFELKFDLEENKIKIRGPDPLSIWEEIQIYGGLLVESGQLIDIDSDDNPDEIKIEYDGNVLEIEGYCPILRVYAQDTVGNGVSLEVLPLFDDDDDNDD